jgi:hypothetical protein
MDEENEKPETNEQRLNREATEYWARVSDKGGDGSGGPEQNRRQARQSEMTESTPPLPGVDPDETDPLVILYSAIRANTDGMKEGTAEAKATRREIAARDTGTKQQLEILKKYVLENTQAIGTFTHREEMIANAEVAKYRWCVFGFLAGMVVLEAGQLLWFHFFG